MRQILRIIFATLRRLSISRVSRTLPRRRSEG